MVRLLLVLAPAACALAGIAIAAGLRTAVAALALGGGQPPPEAPAPGSAPGSVRRPRRRRATALTGAAGLALLSVLAAIAVRYIAHGVFASAVAYSHPSVVLSGYGRSGQRIIHDDFREAYYWLRRNTPREARILSWWDYGYQSAAMADRTTIVDNNTWNTTHIATVGLALCSPEEEGARIMRALDVDYAFVIFGGIARHQGDDINKMLWMVRIAEGEFPDRIRESSFLTDDGRLSVAADTAPRAMRDSLIYRFSYHNFASAVTHGMDPVRGGERVAAVPAFKHFEEVYTTSHWLVRIYKLKKPRETVLPPDEPGRLVI